MHDDAVLMVQHAPSHGRTIDIAPSVGYEQFRQRASTASQEIGSNARPRGLISIPALRASLCDVAAPVFNQHLLRLERNGLIYLIPPGDPLALDADQRR